MVCGRGRASPSNDLQFVYVLYRLQHTLYSMEIPFSPCKITAIRRWLFLAGTAALLLLASTLPQAHGQTVVHFDDPGASWDVARTYPQGNIQNPNFIGTTTRSFSFSGDTLINGDTWKRMYATPTAGTTPVAIFQGYTRQVGDIVLFMAPSGGMDTLYNFALQVGDSMRYTEFGIDFWLTITSIGQVQIQGEAHKVFHFSEQVLTLEDILTDTWIEGIGSIHGPLASRTPSELGLHYAFPDSTRLTCYAQDGTVLWTHGGYSDCVVNIVLTSPELAIERPIIHPNPASSYLIVSGLVAGPYSMLLHDAVGRIVWHTTLRGTESRLDLPPLVPGLYHLRFTASNGQVQRFPLIVE